MYRLMDSMMKNFLNEPTLQRRALEAERAARERRLWIIALIASIASVVSAIAAWMAVLKN